MSSSSSSYASARRVLHRQFLPQHYFSGSGFQSLHRHHNRVSAPTPYFYDDVLNLQFILPSLNHLPPNYHPIPIHNYYHTYNNTIRYNVEEHDQVFHWIQQDEAMILDAVQRNPISTYNNNEVFQDDEVMIVDAVQRNPMSTNSNGGLSKRAISKYLNTRRGNEEDDASEVCIICQDGLLCQEDDDTIGVLNCGHKYHVKCINNWLQVKNLCPLCKSTGIDR